MRHDHREARLSMSTKRADTSKILASWSLGGGHLKATLTSNGQGKGRLIIIVLVIAKAPSKMLTALANLGGSWAAALPWVPELTPKPACMPFKTGTGPRGNAGDAVLMGSHVAEAPLPDVAALPGCMLAVAGGRKGFPEKLGNGLSSGRMRRRPACFCDLACLPACLGQGCPTCPAHPARHTVTRTILIAEDVPQPALVAKQVLIPDATTRSRDKVQHL